MKKRSLFWMRRDLRLQDNAGLFHALKNSDSVACIFVFDKNILEGLSKKDTRIDFIWNCLSNLKDELRSVGSDLVVVYDRPEFIIPILADKYKVDAVYCNEDYEYSAIQRDGFVANKLKEKGIDFLSYKDQAIFAKDEILTSSGQPYTVFTPYANAWRKKFEKNDARYFKSDYLLEKLAKFKTKDLMSLEELGFEETNLREVKIGFSNKEAKDLFENFLNKRIEKYKITRDFPSVSGVSYLSVHNRFGTISVRHLIREAEKIKENSIGAIEGVDCWINELIWRDFYFQLLYHFPHIQFEPFQKQYADFPWENNMENFQKWCDGETGYPLIDAAMTQLNKTGYMHNRLRMLVASFLTKHLLVDYRLGEQYFAEKLLDFDLSANNGGWQWAASIGCDAQPYFRIFNPIIQSEKFDPQGKFIKKMLPIFKEVGEKFLHKPWEYMEELQAVGIIIGKDYPQPIVSHNEAREKVLNKFKLHSEKSKV